MTQIGPLHRHTAPSRTLLWTEHLRDSAVQLGVHDAPESTRAGRIFHAKPWHTEFLAHRGNEQDRAERTVSATPIFSRLYGIVSAA